MNLLADESVARPIVERLRADGHTVGSIGEFARGDPDTQVLVHSVSEACPLLTEDKDFGELVCRFEAEHRGVVLIRIGKLSRAARLELISRVVRDHGHEFAGRITVVTPSGIRTRTPDAQDSTPP